MLTVTTETVAMLTVTIETVVLVIMYLEIDRKSEFSKLQTCMEKIHQEDRKATNIKPFNAIIAVEKVSQNV